MSNVEYELKDCFEIKGLWWIPENPDIKVSGILYYDGKQKIILDLMGSFGSLESLNNITTTKVESILGISDNGYICSLLSNLEVNRQFNAPGILKSKFDVSFLIIGKHLESLSQTSFFSLQVNYTNLERWLSVSPFKKTTPISNSNKEWGLTFKFPKEFTVDVETISAKIESTHDIRTKGDLLTNSHWMSDAYIKFTPEINQEFQWYLDKITDFSNLLTLLIGKSTHFNRIKAICDKGSKEIINIFFPQKGYSDIEVSKFDIIFPYPDLSENISELINGWFKNSKKLSSTYDLFFVTFFNPTMYLQFQFLSLMQAIESFHRATMAGKYLEDEDWKPHKDKLIAQIPSSLDDSFKASLKSRLKFGNEYSLRKRIQELLNSFETSTVESLLLSKRYFTGLLVDTRNYFTHYDETQEIDVLSGEALYWSVIRLKIFVMALLLKKIGVEEQKIISSISKNRELSYALSKK